MARTVAADDGCSWSRNQSLMALPSFTKKNEITMVRISAARKWTSSRSPLAAPRRIRPPMTVPADTPLPALVPPPEAPPPDPPLRGAVAGGFVAGGFVALGFVAGAVVAGGVGPVVPGEPLPAPLRRFGGRLPAMMSFASAASRSTCEGD